MKIICENCQSRFNIPEEKIPEEGPAAFRCPKCKSRIEIPARKTETATHQPAPMATEGDPGDAYGGAFDFIEEEGKTALLCLQDPEHWEQTAEVLDLMEFHATAAENATEALKKIQYHTYDLVVLDENFDTENPDANAILAHLSRLDMAVRRNIFVALISCRHKTLDAMATFHRSVNLVINTSHMGDIGRILERGIAENELFYQPFREALKNTGR